MDRQPPTSEQLSAAQQLNFQNSGQRPRNNVAYLYVDHITGEAYRGVPDRIPQLNVSWVVVLAQVLAENPLYKDYHAVRRKFTSIIRPEGTGNKVQIIHFIAGTFIQHGEHRQAPYPTENGQRTWETCTPKNRPYEQD